MLAKPFIRAMLPRVRDVALLVLLLTSGCSFGQPRESFVPPALAGLSTGRADIIRLTLDAPVIVTAEIVKTDEVKRRDASDLPPGGRRRLVRARITSVIKAPSLTPPQIEYLQDWIPADGGKKPPRLEGARVLVFLAPSKRRDDQYSLIDRRAQTGQEPASERLVRAILLDAETPQLRSLRIAGVSAVFDWGDRRQFLVDTTDGRKLSLDTTPEGSAVKVSFDETSGDAKTVQAGSLLWFRLACELPANLPDAIVQDYQTPGLDPQKAFSELKARLGPCR